LNTILDGSLEQTFQKLIDKAMERREIDLSPFAEKYILTTISDLSSEAHQLVSRPLVITDLIHRGMEADGYVRIEYLRMAGDTALFVSGIFPDSIQVSRHYFNFGDYLDLGQKAYSNINNQIFDELADKFPELVDLLNSVSSEIKLTSNDFKRYVLRRRFIDERITCG